MSKVLKAKYDASENVLRLAEPLDGVKDDETVDVTVNQRAVDSEKPWMAFSGIMSKEDGEDFARVIEEMFPIER